VKIISKPHIYASLFLLLISLAGGSHAQIPQPERDALIALYNSTGGADWSNSTGWMGAAGTECDWYGITCSNGSVTELRLSGNSLSGSIPSELGRLTNLTTLDLAFNSLSGSIPSELGNLTNLTDLFLDINSLSGNIPSELGNLTNLAYLYLNNNTLTGSIPSELGNLTNLIGLPLYNNSLTGSIPPELGNLSMLSSLHLGRNSLSGSIPSELGNLTNLTNLSLDENRLSGVIPPELGNLTNLTGMYLQNNSLRGSIPPELGSLINLTNLYLNDNSLTGRIPSELGNLTNLIRLSLDNNSLSGSIPTSLNSFGISDNAFNAAPAVSISDGNRTIDDTDGAAGEAVSFTATATDSDGSVASSSWLIAGEVVASGTSANLTLGDGTTTVTFRATDDDGDSSSTSVTITVVAPSLERDALIALYNSTSGADWTNNAGWMGAAGTECDWYGITCSNGSVTELRLSGNSLSGSIPSELGNLTNLTGLYLNDNSLSGSIPSELGNLTNLRSLYLYNNSLSGNIPPELGNLSMLVRLPLGRNSLSGDIPSELGNLTNLTNLSLDENRLSGNIPPELGNLNSLTRLILPNNSLSGSIPSELGNLTNLTLLYLNGNSLSGSMPPELGGLTNLTNLYLNDNSLSGSIPSELGNLTNLAVLNLDNNSLSGSVPSSLNSFGISVSAFNAAPAVSISDGNRTIDDTDGAAGETVSFTATATDSDGSVASSSWLINGAEVASGTSANLTLGDGSTTVTFRATDDDGDSTSTSVTITVVAPVIANVAPVVAIIGGNRSIVDTDGLTGETVSLSATATDADGELASTSWLIGGAEVASGTSANLTLGDGSTTVTFRATDDDGDSTSTSVTITVVAPVIPNVAPVVAIIGGNRSIVDTDGLTGETVFVSATATDADGELASTSWLIGGAEVASGTSASLSLADGSTTVTFRATDDDGDSTSTSVTITVVAPVIANVAPVVAIIGGNRSIVDTDGQFDESVSLSATATDADGELTSTSWLIGGAEVASGTSADLTLGDGSTTVTFRATDDDGDSTSTSVTITVGGPFEREALMAFYFDAGGEWWANNTGWMGAGTECDWYGITCSNGIVTELRLGGNSLSGSGLIISGLRYLTNLEYLDLGGNSLSGSIPPEQLRYLTNLEYLDLGGNSLSGSIPSELGNLTNLNRLYLERNSLSGNIPSELGNLTNLTILDLSDNSLTGRIPSELGNLTNLIRLYLDNNSLSGSIPPELGSLINLTNLYLNDNSLTGRIPSELGNLTNLKDWSLRSNRLSGSIPPEVGILTNDHFRTFSYNPLERYALFALVWATGGDIAWDGAGGWGSEDYTADPPGTECDWYGITCSNGSVTELRVSGFEGDLYGELELEGRLPYELSWLTNLTILDLSGHSIGGDLYLSPESPDQIRNEGFGELVNLTKLNLGGNRFTGSIPAELGNLTNLTELNLASNRLTGSIPSELGNLTNLTSLNLDYNSLSGSIPTSLNSFGISDNAFNAAPAVSISGGIRTIDDTDGVAGEVVSVTATATDSDGELASTSWLIGDEVVASGTSARLPLSDGSTTVTFRATDDDGESTSTSVTITVEAPAETKEEFVTLYNGITAPSFLNEEKKINTVSVFDMNKLKLRSCIRLTLGGEPYSLNGYEQYDMNFNLLSLGDLTFGLVDFRPFNLNGSSNQFGETPDCSGQFELSSNVYKDIIAVPGTTEAGNLKYDYYDLVIDLIDMDSLLFKLRDISIITGSSSVR